MTANGSGNVATIGTSNMLVAAMFPLADIVLVVSASGIMGPLR